MTRFHRNQFAGTNATSAIGWSKSGLGWCFHLNDRMQQEAYHKHWIQWLIRSRGMLEDAGNIRAEFRENYRETRCNIRLLSPLPGSRERSLKRWFDMECESAWVRRCCSLCMERPRPASRWIAGTVQVRMREWNHAHFDNPGEQIKMGGPVIENYRDLWGIMWRVLR